MHGVTLTRDGSGYAAHLDGEGDVAHRLAEVVRMVGEWPTNVREVAPFAMEHLAGLHIDGERRWCDLCAALRVLVEMDEATT